MSGIIAVLEQLGSGKAHDVEAALAASGADVDAGEREALLTGDRMRMVEALGTRAWLACFVVAPDDQPMPDEQQPDEPADVPEEHPDAAQPRAA